MSDPAAARYFDGQRAAAHPVALTVEGDVLRLAGDGIAAIWPLRRVRISAALPDGTTSVWLRGGDARLLIRPDAVPPGVVSALRLDGRRASQRNLLVGLATVASLIGLVLALVFVLPRVAASMVPFGVQDWLGRSVETQMAALHPPCTGEEGSAALQGLVDRLRVAAQIDHTVPVTVLDNPAINAFTLPGDRVVIMRGLIDAAQDGDEVSCVIAHELGHVAHHDPLVMALRQVGLSLAVAALGFGDSGTLASIAQRLTTLSFSRAMESAADASALRTLAAAGLRADGLGGSSSSSSRMKESRLRAYLTRIRRPPTA
jgi:beta-barrel assembly-enhancing protease